MLSFTVLANRPTPGQLLQNVRYRDEENYRPRTAGLPRSETGRPHASGGMDGAGCGQSLCLAASPPQDRFGGQLIRQQLRLADRVNSEYGEEESSAESKEMGGTCNQHRAKIAAPISAAHR